MSGVEERKVVQESPPGSPQAGDPLPTQPWWGGGRYA